MANFRVWLVLVVGFFLAAELWQLLRAVTLPTPLLWVGGLVLATASNWHHRAGWPFKWLDQWAAFSRSQSQGPVTQPFHAPGSEVRSPDRR
ncbi:MAG: hypothetical protein VKL01_12945 [Limnothrix sp.]|nr:hypothetical protein [Limnothrix sp.]